MSNLSIFVFLLAALFGAIAQADPSPSPSPSPTVIASTSTIKKIYNSSYANVISKAIFKSHYIAQAAFAVADRIGSPSSNQNLSLVCFVEPRDFNSKRPPLDLLREDREYLIGLQNYTQLVANTICSNNYTTLCVNINTSLAYIKELRPLLDQIITRGGERGASSTQEEERGSGEAPLIEEESQIDSRCWNTSLGQLYWNFNALGMLADLYLVTNLDAIKTAVI